MSTLPAPRSGLPAMPAGPVPSSVRQKALGEMDRVLAVWREILNDPEQKGATRNTAGKLIAEVAAVRQTQTIPRDVVEEKIRETARFLQDRLGDAVYAQLADGLSAVWDI